MTPDSKLAPWLRKQLRQLGERGIVTRVELFFATEGEGIGRLAAIPVAEGVDVDELTQEVWDTAERDASTRAVGMPQRYVLAGFLEEDSVPVCQFPFIINGGGSGTAIISASSEPANEKGEIAQRLRHTEQLHKMLIEQTAYTSAALRKELEEERRIRTGYETKFMEMLEIQQQLMDRKHERDMERARMEASQRRHDEIMGLVGTVLPVVAAQFTGGLGLKGTPILRDEGIRGFLKGLSEDEVNNVIGSLKPQNQMLLLELYKSYKEDDKKRHPLLNGVESGEETKH